MKNVEKKLLEGNQADFYFSSYSATKPNRKFPKVNGI